MSHYMDQTCNQYLLLCIIIIIIIIMYRSPKEYYVHIISYIVSNLHKVYLNSSIDVDEITDSGRLFHIRIVEG